MSSPPSGYLKDMPSESILRVKTQNESIRSEFGQSTSYASARRLLDHRQSAEEYGRCANIDTGELYDVSINCNNQDFREDISFKQRTGGTHVSFSKVDIRHYPIILGDNPAVSGGPPVSIGWKYHSCEEVSVDEFENFKDRVIGRRAARKIDPCTRADILEVECNVTYPDIVLACNECAAIREQRHRSMTQSRSSVRMEAISKSLKKSLNKRISRVRRRKRDKFIQTNSSEFYAVDE